MLHVHRADRADALVTALGDLLATPLADPFAQEIVSVPTRGVERWLTQCLATRLGTRQGRQDGIVANVAFPSPRQLADEAIGVACGFDHDADPWQPQRTVWPLLELVDGALAEPWLATLAEHLKDSAGTKPQGAHHRRFSAVRHIANLFDRYAIQRPQLLTAWTAGEGVDASNEPLPPSAQWQAELWRRLRDRIAEPDPSERTTTAITRITDDRTTTQHLPQRLSIFGLTRLPPGHLDVVRAIAIHRHVHLYLLHPSPALWHEIATNDPPTTRAPKRADDPTATTPRHRLLASWGRDVRELQLVLGPPTAYEDDERPHDSSTPQTLLQHLQHAIRTDTPSPTTAQDRPTLTEEDRSIEIHSCHGHARQLEVLRDAVLHALDEDPTLQPRDVIVMCPDIETFAPLIQATFGTTPTYATNPTKPHDPTTPETDLRVRLADRATTQTNPLLGTVARLLELGDQRLTASQVLDFFSREPIRRRFGLDDDVLVRFEDWIATTGIRWGLDTEHRAPFKLQTVAANTWRAGTDRVLLGATMTEDRLPLVGGVLPLDDVESGAIDLAGRFAELIDRLKTTTTAFATPKPIDEWATAIAQAADLLTATSARDAWQRAALDRLLADLTQQAATSTSHLDLAEIRALLAEHLEGRPTRANFRTGHLTICTLHPMRTVPHRVIGLLGLDDTVFPRKTPRDSDDLLLADPFVGDHDPRTEDRQMLLDALMAAQDKLIVTYTGNDERTNAPRPPAVPVGELLDAIDRTVTTKDDTTRPRDRITIRHPLQPFNPRNFTPGALRNDTRPWSFDPVTLNGARAITSDRTPQPPFLTDPLEPLDSPVIELEDLVRFVHHPCKAFLRRRLGISLASHEDEILDNLPLELDGLEKWGVGDRLLNACLAGSPRTMARAAEDARGTLPPGIMADGVVTPIGRNVAALLGAAESMLTRTTDLDSLDVRVTLPDGRALTGTVSGLCDDTLQSVGYSRLAPKHRLAAWVRLLALTAARPERPFEAITIGLLRAFGDKDFDVSVSRIPPLGDDAETRRKTALKHLATLVDLQDRGLREPPPLACVTSHAYALALRRGADPTKDANNTWTSSFDWDKEDKDREHVLLHGRVLSLEDLLDEPARPDETGPDWPATGEDTTRFGRWALRLWTGLLDVEELRDR